MPDLSHNKGTSTYASWSQSQYAILTRNSNNIKKKSKTLTKNVVFQLSVILIQHHLKIMSNTSCKFSGCVSTIPPKAAITLRCFLKSALNIFQVNSSPKIYSLKFLTLSIYSVLSSSCIHLTFASTCARFSLLPGFTTKNSSSSGAAVDLPVATGLAVAALLKEPVAVEAICFQGDSLGAGSA